MLYLLSKNSVHVICSSKFNCLVYEMLFIRKLKPSLNVQSDFINAKLLLNFYCFLLYLILILKHIFYCILVPIVYLLRSMKWNASLIFLWLMGGGCPVHGYRLKNPHSPVRTPKWPPRLRFAGVCHGQ